MRRGYKWSVNLPSPVMSKRYASTPKITPMAKWQYMTLVYGANSIKHGRRWVIVAHDAISESKQVGQAEKGRFIGQIWQAMRLLETALEELDADGWELVSASFSGTFGFYGTAVLRRQRTEVATNAKSQG